MVWGRGPSAASTNKNSAIDHGENAFHLSAEIGMARGIDDIDAQIAMKNGGAFGKNGDAAFAFEVIAVHRAFDDLLVVAESAGLPQHRVYERRFPMVDMGDDGDIA